MDDNLSFCCDSGHQPGHIPAKLDGLGPKLRDVFPCAPNLQKCSENDGRIKHELGVFRQAIWLCLRIGCPKPVGKSPSKFTGVALESWVETHSWWQTQE